MCLWNEGCLEHTEGQVHPCMVPVLLMLCSPLPMRRLEHWSGSRAVGHVSGSLFCWQVLEHQQADSHSLVPREPSREGKGGPGPPRSV